MSSGSEEKRAEVLGELRQFNGLGASFFRMAAARIGMTVTDTQVIDILDSTGPMTAGQIADLTGLTTGAITGMLNRLEEAGFIQRERDPNDGRRVIVQLTPGKDKTHQIDPIFASIGKAWDEVVSHYDDEQLTFLLEFLKHSNAIARQEIFRLREAPEEEGRLRSAPIGDLQSARLIIPIGLSQLTLSTDEKMTELYQASFEGAAPDVKAKDGVVTVRYPRHLWVLGWEQRSAEITLNATIPWQIAINGGASVIVANLGKLYLAGLEVKGGLSSIHLELAIPSSMAIPIRISGGASEITIRRPAGAAARVHLKGWASTFVFDDQTFSNMGNDVRLQSSNYEATAPYYNIEVASSVSTVSITSG